MMIDCTERGRNPHQPIIKGEITQMAKTLTPKEIALEFGVSAKTLRKFLRKDEKAIAAQGGETPGKGGRWAIPATQVKSLQKRFDAWMQAQREEQAKRREQAEQAEQAESPVGDDAPETPEGEETAELLNDEEIAETE